MSKGPQSFCDATAQNYHIISTSGFPSSASAEYNITSWKRNWQILGHHTLLTLTYDTRTHMPSVSFEYQILEMTSCTFSRWQIKPEVVISQHSEHSAEPRVMFWCDYTRAVSRGSLKTIAPSRYASVTKNCISSARVVTRRFHSVHHTTVRPPKYRESTITVTQAESMVSESMCTVLRVAVLMLKTRHAL